MKYKIKEIPLPLRLTNDNENIINDKSHIRILHETAQIYERVCIV